MKIKVGILDRDQVYVSRLIQYFTTYYFDRLEVSAFHNTENFLEFIQHTKIDIFLTDPNLVPEDIELPKTMIMAYLTETSQAQSVNDVYAVFKFQRAELLYREILGLYAELDKKTAYRETEGNSPVYLFLGASGGVGTTTAAIACAMSLASYGKKVLYLNLEENGVTEPFLKGDGNATFSDVLYAVKSKSSNLVLKLESMVRKSRQGVYFFEPFSVALDAHEMMKDDLTKILDTIAMYLAYDYIVIDSDSAVLWKRDLLLKYAKYVFLVCDGTEISNQKLQKFLQELTITDENEEKRTMSKIKILYNRFTDQRKKADTEYQESVYGTINELNNQSSMQVAEQIAQKPLFDKLL